MYHFLNIICVSFFCIYGLPFCKVCVSADNFENQLIEAKEALFSLKIESVSFQNLVKDFGTIGNELWKKKVNKSKAAEELLLSTTKNVAEMAHTIVTLKSVTSQHFLKVTFKFLDSFHFLYGSSDYFLNDGISYVYKWFSKIIALFEYNGHESIIKVITKETNKLIQQYQITYTYPSVIYNVADMQGTMSTMEENIIKLQSSSLENKRADNETQKLLTELEKYFKMNFDYIESRVRKNCIPSNTEYSCQFCLEAIELYVAFSIQLQFLRLKFWSVLFNGKSNLSQIQRVLYGEDIKNMEKRFQAFHAFDELDDDLKKIKKTCVIEFYGKPNRYLFLEEYLRYLAEKEFYYNDNTQHKYAFKKVLFYCSKINLEGDCKAVDLENEIELKVDSIRSLFVPSKVKVTPYVSRLIRDNTVFPEIYGPTVIGKTPSGITNLKIEKTDIHSTELIRICLEPNMNQLTRCMQIPKEIESIGIDKLEEWGYARSKYTEIKAIKSIFIPSGMLLKLTVRDDEKEEMEGSYVMNLRGPIIRENICFNDKRFIRSITVSKRDQNLLVKVCEQSFFNGMCDYIDDDVTKVVFLSNNEKAYDLENIHSCAWKDGFSSFMVPYGFQVETTQYTVGEKNISKRNVTGLQYILETKEDNDKSKWWTLKPVRKINIKLIA